MYKKYYTILINSILLTLLSKIFFYHYCFEIQNINTTMDCAKANDMKRVCNTIFSILCSPLLIFFISEIFEQLFP